MLVFSMNANVPGIYEGRSLEVFPPSLAPEFNRSTGIDSMIFNSSFINTLLDAAY